jgi:hypothetical protein
VFNNNLRYDFLYTLQIQKLIKFPSMCTNFSSCPRN